VSVSGLSVRKNTDRSKYDLAALQEEILKSGNCVITPRSGVKDVAYVTCNLNKYPPNAKSNYTKAYNALENLSSLKFPLKLSFGYTYTDESGGKSTIVQKSHESCIDVEVFLDKRLKPAQLPNGLLKGTVSAANSTVQAIDQVLKPLKTIKLATLGACLGSKAYSVYSYTKEETACWGYAPVAASPVRRALEQAVRGCADASCDKVTTICDSAGDKQSDCMSCADAISSRRNTEKFSNAVCDRIFCPSVPTLSQYVKDVTENKRKSMSSACSRLAPNPWAPSQITSLTREEGCGLEYVNEWSYGCLAYDEFAESQKLAQKAANPDDPLSDFAKTYDQVMDSLSFCSANQKNKETSRDAFTYNKNTFYREDFDKSGSYENDCFKLGSFEKTSSLVREGNDLVAKDTKEVVKPATVDYKNIPPQGQCLRTANDGTLILTPMGKDANGLDTPIVYDPKNVQAVKAKTDPEFPRTNIAPDATLSVYNNGEYGVDADGYYYKRLASGEYQVINPKSDKGKFFNVVCKERTTNAEADKYSIVSSGDTVPSNCVVQNGPEDLRNEKVRAILIDPKESFINSFRCGCLPALEGYLMVIRNVLNAVKNCFNSVIVTGEFQAGACRSLLSQYLCDWIFNIIRCFTSAAGKLQEIGKTSTDSHEGGIGAIRALQQGSARMSQSMMDRYGDTTSYQSLISSRRLVHAACLAAFGYDWLPDLDQAISIEGDGFTVNSTAFVLTADRQYLSSNPLNRGYATFIYESGYFISAGSNLDYSVELVCSNDNSCNPAEGFVGGTCDCAWGSSKGEKKYTVERGTAKGGQSVGDSDGKGQKFVK
ncbi:MAG TPA: hypothetical protein VK158_05180, partial [Acidobacteriota bacterium]|nr:hypothetical protein [Acidobacteriota bacterium]